MTYCISVNAKKCLRVHVVAGRQIEAVVQAVIEAISIAVLVTKEPEDGQEVFDVNEAIVVRVMQKIAVGSGV